MVRSAFGSALLILGATSIIAGQADRVAVYTAEQAARGKVAVKANAFGVCSDCHAEGLTGRIGSSQERPLLESLLPELQKQIANFRGRVPDLVGPAFRTRWGNRSIEDLSVNFEKRFAFALSEETRLDILAYVLQENGFRAGHEPLTMATDVPFRSLAGPGAP